MLNKTNSLIDLDTWQSFRLINFKHLKLKPPLLDKKVSSFFNQT